MDKAIKDNIDPIKEAMEKPMTREEAGSLIMECIENRIMQYGMFTGMFIDILNETNKDLVTEYMLKAQRLISLLGYIKENLK